MNDEWNQKALKLLKQLSTSGCVVNPILDTEIQELVRQKEPGFKRKRGNHFGGSRRRKSSLYA